MFYQNVLPLFMTVKFPEDEVYSGQGLLILLNSAKLKHLMFAMEHCSRFRRIRHSISVFSPPLPLFTLVYAITPVISLNIGLTVL